MLVKICTTPTHDHHDIIHKAKAAKTAPIKRPPMEAVLAMAPFDPTIEEPVAEMELEVVVAVFDAAAPVAVVLLLLVPLLELLPLAPEVATAKPEDTLPEEPELPVEVPLDPLALEVEVASLAGQVRLKRGVVSEVVSESEKSGLAPVSLRVYQ